MLDKVKEKLLTIAKIEAKRRLNKAVECINFLDEVVETYVTDDVVKNSAKKCIEYLKEQTKQIENIIKDL